VSKPKFLRFGKRAQEPSGETTEFVPRTEQAEAARAARDWLRDRNEVDVPDWVDEDTIF
jgi:hypothetical protein